MVSGFLQAVSSGLVNDVVRVHIFRFVGRL